ncbi:hypothetical protein NL676_007450 [Syzygium grande]|nr:hypothetical protein NL676_007450 [Syzygium grande]
MSARFAVAYCCFPLRSLHNIHTSLMMPPTTSSSQAAPRNAKAIGLSFNPQLSSRVESLEGIKSVKNVSTQHV